MSTELRDRSNIYTPIIREQDNRLVSAEERKTYDIKKFWARHHEMTDLSNLGFTNVEIADILHVHPQTVSNTLNSTLGKEVVAIKREERDGEARKRREQIRVLTEKALGVYHDAFDNDDGQLSLQDKVKVADTVILEMSGLRVAQKTMNASVTTVLTSDELKEIKERGLATARESGLIIDITPKE